MHQFAENIATAEQAYAPVHVPQASGPSTQQQRPTKKTTTPDQPRDSAYVSPVSQASRLPSQQPSRNTFVTAWQHHGSVLAVTGSHAVLPLKQHQPAEKKATTTAHPQSDPLSKAIRRWYFVAARQDRLSPVYLRCESRHSHTQLSSSFPGCMSGCRRSGSFAACVPTSSNTSRDRRHQSPFRD
jgi:hypothetical protein